ncbi:MAG: hypothetical protein AAGC46_21220, partial [Solirubrobacteraceae bacterium]
MPEGFTKASAPPVTQRHPRADRRPPASTAVLSTRRAPSNATTSGGTSSGSANRGVSAAVKRRV